MFPHEAAQHLGQPGRYQILGGAEAQAAAQPGSGEMPPRALICLEDVPGEFNHRLAFYGQGDRMGVAHESHGRPPFQLADMIAHRRLAQAKLAARFGKAVALRDDEKCLQERGIEHRPGLSENSITLIGTIGVPNPNNNCNVARRRPDRRPTTRNEERKDEPIFETEYPCDERGWRPRRGAAAGASAEPYSAAAATRPA